MANLHALRLDLISGNNHKRHLEPSLVEEQAEKKCFWLEGRSGFNWCMGLPSSGRSQSGQLQGSFAIAAGKWAGDKQAEEMPSWAWPLQGTH